jgi:hypothetical protein
METVAGAGRRITLIPLPEQGLSVGRTGAGIVMALECSGMWCEKLQAHGLAHKGLPGNALMTTNEEGGWRRTAYR